MTKQKIAELRKSVSPYEKTDLKASVRQMINTIPPFFILWFLAYQSLEISYLLTLGLGIIAAGFVVRIFIIFHDCCHGSFFKNKKLNNLVGTITGIITMFPYEKWKREHSIHHATSGNLDKRGTGDIWIMTVEEYKKASWKERLSYRLYRNPLVMFGLGPVYLFLVTNRMNRSDARKKERKNTYLTNVSIVVLYTLMILLVGWEAFLLVHGPIMFVSGMLGIWLFYVQHQFEDSYFEDESEWDYVKAAVDGSSYYKLPKVLQWVTGNIGYHHVHHLSPRVPNYHLEKAHESTPPLQKATTITMKSSLESIRFRLYDETRKTFVSFNEVKQQLKKEKMRLEMRRMQTKQ
ncbi:fatty acid desaturase [Jeotgalibacillus sp. R-1-5s-1]|uniref:fatty acid desaturase n=1 Tax=Jeotgalibacillus sp. R-1-5s-1 TaxID=2555897 RepID=UPI00106A386D|nr:fatty acid desaturase [Jeotgalibacillus sp. R-1-5s-1]TFE01807.1 fatty acid desaturase [Jeotgalibacillus sp. R-1-5s-1]